MNKEKMVHCVASLDKGNKKMIKQILYRRNRKKNEEKKIIIKSIN